MPASKRKSGTDWPKVKRTKITRQEYEDMPEWTDEQLDRAEFAIGGKVIRPAKGTLTRPRGRPRSEHPTETITLRLDAELVQVLKESGPDWRKRATKAVERLAKRCA